MVSSVSGCRKCKVNPIKNLNSPVLEIKNLTVSYLQGGLHNIALRDFSICVQKGQTYGLVGESGSGKSTAALSIMGYLPEEARVRTGKVLFNGVDLLTLESSKIKTFWGNKLSLVPQHPHSSLNPSMRIQEQISEGIQFHRKYSSREI